MDFIEPLLMDNDKDYILTITDCLFSDICLIPCQLDLTVKELAGLFFEYWYCENGLSLNIVSVHNKLPMFLENAKWINWSQTKNVISISSPNRQIQWMLKQDCQSVHLILHAEQPNWLNIMNTINSSTNMSGFQLCLGHSPWIILPIVPLQLVDTETLTFPVSWKTSKIWLLKQGTPPTGENWPISFCYCITGKGD